MEYIVYHEATIEADSEEEAKQSYIELWKEGFYSDDDLEVDETK